MALVIGEQAPSFTLPDATGRTRELAEMIGARSMAFVVLDDLGDASGVHQLREFRAHLNDFNAQLVNLAVVAKMTPEQGARALEVLDVRFPWLCDADGSLARAWGVWDDATSRPAPSAVVVDREAIALHCTRGSASARPSAPAVVAALAAGKPDSKPGSSSASISDRLAAWRLRRG